MTLTNFGIIKVLPMDKYVIEECIMKGLFGMDTSSELFQHFQKRLIVFPSTTLYRAELSIRNLKELMFLTPKYDNHTQLSGTVCELTHKRQNTSSDYSPVQSILYEYKMDIQDMKLTIDGKEFELIGNNTYLFQNELYHLN